MYVCIGQVFRENNITITYSSEFERFPSDGYIRSVMEKTKQEGRSESDSVSELEHNTVDLFTIFLWQGPGVLWRRNQGERLSSFFFRGRTRPSLLFPKCYHFRVSDNHILHCDREFSVIPINARMLRTVLPTP